MRGYVYEITDNIEEVNYMEESDFYDYAGFEADYFADVEDETVIATNIDHMLYRLLGKNMAESVTTRLFEGDGVRSFVMTDDIKRAYFKTRYEELCRRVSALTLDEFALGAPDDTSYALRTLIDNDYEDAVFLNDGCGIGVFCTFDSFVRESISGRVYYVGNRLVLMH
jgi:hypothetical protein